ncbi:DUF418 domain-containing protein [Paenibacillus xylanivorans]|uniref:DUF418 domain-containing protein n=1 Tax=Paenibacillus xylanivorans TaxID=1705561 RepID=A0A0M9BRX8_9BACL|nr:DUF418 domain-containing protein [Paenibacillus xylanivorans]KOY17589.1 hypothetical protein AMS66_04855 [Paenibacillus xylanivorans]
MNQPVSTQQRIVLLDLFRGFALLGLPFVNVLGLWSMLKPENDLDFWIQRGLYFLVEARFYDIFSFLFGLGFYLFMSRAAAKGKPKLLLYLLRILMLLVIGYIHQQYQSGETLFIYGIVGLIILPLYWAPRTVNLVLAVLGCVVTAALGIKILTLPFLILLGLAAGQYRLLEKIQNGLPHLRIIWLTALIASMAGIGIMWWIAPPDAMSPYLFEVVGATLPVAEQTNMDAAFLLQHIGVATGPVVSIFYLSTLLLLNRRHGYAQLLHPLQAFGRMALTNYIGQTVILLGVYQLVLKEGAVSYTISSIVCLGAVIVQIIVSNLWMRWFEYGPLEWIWRCGTYLSFIPIRRKTS